MNVNYKVYDLVSCAMNGTVASRAFATDGWDRCNAVVLTWIMNFVSSDVYMGLVYSVDVASVWKELKSTYDKVDGSMIFNLLQKISSIKQGGSSVADYYHRLNSLWREFDALTKLPTCTCDANKELGLHNQLMKLMQFLMGLDDCYQSVRSALLTRDPLPEVKDAYTTVSREESHRGIPEPSNVTESKINATSFAAKGFNVNKRNNFSSNNNSKGETLLIIISKVQILICLVKTVDLKKEITLGTGSESVGLYLFDMEPDNNIGKVNMVVSCHVFKDLWHNRLGHPAHQVLNVRNKSLNDVADVDFTNEADHLTFFDNQLTQSPNDEGRATLVEEGSPTFSNTDTTQHQYHENGSATQVNENSLSEGNLSPRPYVSTHVPTHHESPELIGSVQNEFRRSSRVSKLPVKLNDYVIDIVSKSFAVTTADASDKRQQQQDSTSSTSTLATTMHSVLETSTASAGINQQGTSHEVSVSTDDRGWRWKRIVKDKEVKRREAIHTALAEKGSNAYLSVLTNKMILFDDKSSHGPSECNATTLLSQLRIYLNIDFDFISHGEIYSFYRLYHSEIVDIDKVVFLNGYASSSHMTDVRFKTSHALSTKIITMMKAQSIKEIVCKLSDL
ncbi:ribonuclease H-like domain-containing protein [Tanacetum coccineum]